MVFLKCTLPGVVTPLPGALVRPGSMYTYEWTVPIGAGPVQGEADCLTYLYYSAVDPVKDTSSGLVGPLLVCRPGSLKKGVQVRILEHSITVKYINYSWDYQAFYNMANCAVIGFLSKLLWPCNIPFLFFYLFYFT